MRSWVVRGAVATICVGTLVVASACSSSSGGSSGGKSPIQIGLIADITGLGATDAVPFADGAKVAVDDINSAGGINGRKVSLVVQDDQSTTSTAISALTTLASAKHLHVIMCECASSILIPVVERAKSIPDVTIINAGAGATSIRNLPAIMVWTLPANDVLTAALAKWAWNNGARKVAILGQNDAYGTDVATQLGKAWKALGGTVLSSNILSSGLSDYTSDMRRVSDESPDAVLSGTYGADAALQFKTITALGSKAPWYNLYPEYSNEASLSGSTNRVYGLEPGWSATKNPGAAQRIAKADPKTPVGYFSALGYDTAQVSARASALLSSNSVSAVQKAMVAAGAKYQGLTGTVEFDSGFVRTNAIYAKSVARNGKLVPVP